MKSDSIGYLFVHFTGESEAGEQVYFSISKDGLHWKDLNEGNPVLTSSIGELGVRDPFILRSVNGDKYYIIATDLRIASGKGWTVAQHQGSRSIVIWESTDLFHWSKERTVEVGIPEAGCVWAPEAIYDSQNHDYMVFWASLVREEGENSAKHRIYYSKTKDFKTFTKAEKYIERENDVIDTTIIQNNGYYYRISKDETTKNIRIDKGLDLLHGPFTPVSAPRLEQLVGVEGPAAFQFNESKDWCLMVDHFAVDGGYLPLVSSDLASGDFAVLDPSRYHMGENKKRHGSVLALTRAEFEALISQFESNDSESDNSGSDNSKSNDSESDNSESDNSTSDNSESDDSKSDNFKNDDFESDDSEHDNSGSNNSERDNSKRHNPIIKGLYADPDIAQFGDTYYIYPTTDGFSHWSGTKFHVFSSQDRIHWRDEGVILDVATDEVPWAVGSAWAPAIARKEGKYYFYFCAKRPDGKSCIGVAVSDSPIGPFVAQAEPLITPEMMKLENIKMSQTIDPSIYIEEEGTPYLLFGNGDAAIVPLNSDMVSFQPGTMRQLDGAYDFREAITVIKREGIYHFTWSCDDTGSEDYHINYGVCDNIYGPIKFIYTLMEKNKDENILGTGHHSILKLEDEEEYYIAYHRFGTPLKQYPFEKGCHREVCLDQLEFTQEGLIKTAKVTN